jgi:pimeloyl-ACP methyl ester carboxylesterase
MMLLNLTRAHSLLTGKLCLALGLWSAAVAGQQPSQSNSLDVEHLDVLNMLRSPRSVAHTPLAGINEKLFVPVGGIDQWITIRGQDRANPVLLLLHGGPGDATNPWAYAVLAPWERSFTVVQWDQRGAGKTLGKSGTSIAPTITIDRMTKDGIELAEFLRSHLNKKKIIILGHSWGSALGTLMAKQRPDLFHAYVGTGQVVDGKRNYGVAYQALLSHARRERNLEAIRELEAIGPPPYDDAPRKQQVQRKWSNEFEGSGPFLLSTAGWAIIKPESSLADVADWLEGQNLSGTQLFKSLGSLDLIAAGTDFALPMFFIQGADDYTCPTSLVQEYFKKIKAPHKELVMLKGGGHFAVFMQPRAFLNELVTRVRPLGRE